MSLPLPAVSTAYRFSLGSFECMALSDGEYTYPIESLFANVDEETVNTALRRRNLPTGKVTTPYTCLFINTGAHKVLVDVGAGDLAPTTGTMVRHLKAANIDPADIDTIIITHAHPDHIGGNLDIDGNPLYPNARYFLWKEEWEFWNSESATAKWGRFVPFVRKNLDPVREQLTLLDREQEIVPGIQTVAAPGHTPGHSAVAIYSNHEQLLHVVDTVIYPLHLEYPDWLPVFDIQPELAAASKRQIFDRAVAERALVFAHHFPPFPNLGYVLKRGDGWLWRSVNGEG
jgi:glyoxylase-like metal-dependent hydrolase (beta-lactamase superfamily II)